MERTRQGVASLPEQRAGASGRRIRATEEVIEMSPSANRRQLPELPKELLEAAASPLADVLEIVIFYVENLPVELMQVLEGRTMPATLEVLHDAASGLRAMREGEYPSEDELSAIIHSRLLMEDLSAGIKEVMQVASASPALKEFVDGNITTQLDAAATALVPPDRHLALTGWLHRFGVAVDSFAPRPPENF